MKFTCRNGENARWNVVLVEVVILDVVAVVVRAEKSVVADHFVEERFARLRVHVECVGVLFVALFYYVLPLVGRVAFPCCFADELKQETCHSMLFVYFNPSKLPRAF